MDPDLFTSIFLKMEVAMALASFLGTFMNFIMPRVSSSSLSTPSPLRSSCLKDCWS